MLCLLCQRLYIPLICICYACWDCLRQSASHVPTYFWRSLLSLISWSMENDNKYFMRYISWSISSQTNVCGLVRYIVSLWWLCFPWIYTGSLGWWDKWGHLQPLCHCSLLIWRPVCFEDAIDCCLWLQKEADSCYNTWEYQSTAVPTAGHQDLISLPLCMWTLSEMSPRHSMVVYSDHSWDTKDYVASLYLKIKVLFFRVLQRDFFAHEWIR